MMLTLDERPERENTRPSMSKRTRNSPKVDTHFRTTGEKPGIGWSNTILW